MAEGAGFRAWADGIGMKQEHWRRAGGGRPAQAEEGRRPRGRWLWGPGPWAARRGFYICSDFGYEDFKLYCVIEDPFTVFFK